MYGAARAPEVYDPDDEKRRRARLLLSGVARAAGLEPSRATGAELIHRGDEHFDRAIAGIREAREQVDLEIYQIGSDAVGRRLCGALARAAARGVRVRVLADSFGSGHVGSWLRWLETRGVETRWYNAWRPWRSPWRHTHRKLLLIDQQQAAIGGMNFTSVFSARHSGRDAWRDVALWLSGPVVTTFQRQLEGAWAAWGGTPGPVRVSGGESLAGRDDPHGSSEQCSIPCAVAGGPEGRSGLADAVDALLRSADQEVLLATPYFLPDRRLQAELIAAAQRGVRIVIVLPRLNDLCWFKHGARCFYNRLLEAGVEIWERCDRMVHAKVAVVDQAVAAIGSANLNHQSLHNNAETLLLTSEPGIVAEIHGLLDREAASAAERLDPLSWPAHPDRRPLAELLSAPMSLVL